MREAAAVRSPRNGRKTSPHSPQLEKARAWQRRPSATKYKYTNWSIIDFRTDASKLRSWRRLLRVLWIARTSSQSVPKEINPGYSLEGLMLKLKLQSFGHWIQRADSLENNTDARKDWGQEEKRVTEDEMVGWHHWPNGREFEQTLADREGQESLVCCRSWGRKELSMTEQLNNNSNWLTLLY